MEYPSSRNLRDLHIWPHNISLTQQIYLECLYMPGTVPSTVDKKMQRCRCTQSGGERPYSLPARNWGPGNGHILVWVTQIVGRRAELKPRSAGSCLVLLSTLGLKYSKGNEFDYVGNVYGCKDNWATKLAPQKELSFLSYTCFLISRSHCQPMERYLMLLNTIFNLYSQHYLGVIIINTVNTYTPLSKRWFICPCWGTENAKKRQ